jgi:hypothetical protein
MHSNRVRATGHQIWRRVLNNTAMHLLMVGQDMVFKNLGSRRVLRLGHISA